MANATEHLVWVKRRSKDPNLHANGYVGFSPTSDSAKRFYFLSDALTFIDEYDRSNLYEYRYEIEERRT